EIALGEERRGHARAPDAESAENRLVGRLRLWEERVLVQRRAPVRVAHLREGLFELGGEAQRGGVSVRPLRFRLRLRRADALPVAPLVDREPEPEARGDATRAHA